MHTPCALQKEHGKPWTAAAEASNATTGVALYQFGVGRAKRRPISAIRADGGSAPPRPPRAWPGGSSAWSDSQFDTAQFGAGRFSGSGQQGTLAVATLPDEPVMDHAAPYNTVSDGAHHMRGKVAGELA